MATFSILTPEQTKHIRPVNPTSVRHLLNNNHDDAIHYINSLLKTSKPDELNETYWFPTPQNPGNEQEHTPIQTRILNELRELEQLEKLNPLENTDPNAIDFDDSHTQGPDTVIVPRSYFHDSRDGQNRETCPISDPSVPRTLTPTSIGQNQDNETSTDLTQNDNTKHVSESSTDAEITCKPVTQPPSMQSDTSSTLDSNNSTAENIPKKGI